MRVPVGQPAEGQRAGKQTPLAGRRWWALIVISVSQLMVSLDSTITNIALPSAQRSLHMSADTRQWVLTAYLIAFGGLLLLGGRIADLAGHKRTLTGGVLGFAAASALGGTAASAPVLIAARALQGTCAALMTPAALALLSATFPGLRERSRAVSVFSAITGSGAAVGLMAGGALTQYLGWRWSLLVNLPIGLAVALGAGVTIHACRTERRRLDILGAAAITLSLVALIFGFSHAETAGWSAPSTLALLTGAAGGVAVFAVIERRTAAPLLPFAVIADRARAAAFLSQGLTVMAMFGLFLFLTYVLQTVDGYSPLMTGVAFLPLIGGMLAGSWLAAGRLRASPVTLMTGGCAIAAAGALILFGLRPGSPYWLVILPATVVFGFGRSVAFTPAMSLATHRVDPRDTGVASGLVNASQQVGGAVGTALLNTVAVTAAAGWLRSRPGTPALAAQVHGYATGAAWAAGILLVAAVSVYALNRPAEAGR